MRSNLLSLQNIAGQVDLTQNRLSIGLKVNSAIDNPSSYYTAVSLNNRASDLSALLDSMAQGIQTIKAATEGLEAGAGLLEQAAATATQALETMNIPAKSWFEEQDGVAAVVSTKEELLAAIDSGKKGDIVIYGQIDMGDTSITLKEGQNLKGVGAYGAEDNEVDKFSALSFSPKVTAAITTKDAEVVVSDLSLILSPQEGNWIPAVRMTQGGTCRFLDIQLNQDYNATRSALLFGIRTDDGELFLEGRINIRDISKKQDPAKTVYAISGDADDLIAIKNNANINIATFQDSSYAFYGGRVEIGQGSVNIAASGSMSYAFMGGSLTLSDQAQLNVKNTHSPIFNRCKIDIQSATAKILLDAGNKHQFNSDGGNCSLKAVAGAQLAFKNQLFTAKDTIADFYEIHSGVSPDISSNQTSLGFWEENDITGSEDLKDFADYFAERFMVFTEKKVDTENFLQILQQYDALIKDSSYKGINLLQEQNMTVIFNEDRSAQLAVKGKNASTKALGLMTTSWETQDDVAQSLNEIAAALNQIRQMSSELGNYYSIVTTREDFTQNLINVLIEGADKLTLVDMNEESANMLALQTRQQLAVNSLSLASQASQSILKLF